MTLNELRYILAVARERHFGRAAESCHVSQPSLSVAVKKLEDELQVKIFERRSNDVTLTPTGAAIVEEAQRILSGCDRLREAAAQGRDPLTGPLRLGVIYTIAPYLVPQLVAGVHSLVPDMPLVLTENYTSGLLEQLKNGEIDCAIMALPIVYTNVLEGIRQTDAGLLEMCDVFDVRGWDRVRLVYASEVLPYFRAAVTLALGLSWKAGIAAEVIGLPDFTIGEHLYDAKVYLDTPNLFAWTLAVIVASVALEALVTRVMSWAMGRWEARP